MSDGMFTTQLINLDGYGSFKVIPIGDVHHDAPNFDPKSWKRYIKKLKEEQDENTFYIGMGDYLDFVSWNERKKLRNADLHESTISTLDDKSMSLVTSFLDDLWFTRGKWLGMIQGNHDWVFTFGDVANMTATQYLCERLGCKYLADLACIGLSRKIRKSGGGTFGIDIFASHGIAGGRTHGASVNQVARLKDIFDDADIYIMGHDHQAWTKPETKLKMIRNGSTYEIGEKKQLFARSGSFLRSYVANKRSYAASAHYKPSHLGSIEIFVDVHRRCQTVDGKTLDRIIVDISGRA